MADYAITAANVQYGSTATGTLVAGEALAAGDIIYRKASDGKAYKADANAAGADAALGMCVNSAAAGQPVSYVTSGEVEVGAAVFTGAGKPVILSGTAGKMADVGDAVAGWKLVLLGWSTGTSKLKLNIVQTGITLA
jgi:hypothetical protein